MQDTQTISYAIPVAHEQEYDRVEFIRKTYSHVALAVLLFIIVEALFLNIPFFVKIGLAMTQGWTWLLVLGGFMFITNRAETWAMKSTNKQNQYAALTIFVMAEAFIFIPLIYMAISMTGDLSLINQAAILTLALFGGLTGIVFFTKKDFSFLGAALKIGFMLAIGAIVAGMIFGFNLGLAFSVIMVALAAGSILYQTSKIMNHYHKDQYVAASLGLFASLMLLFWYILSIVSRFSD